MRRKGRTVRDRAPGIGVAPGAAAADAPRARRRTTRPLRGRDRVVVVREPVRAPLVTDAGEVGEAEAIDRRRPHAWELRDGTIRARVAPRIARGLEPAARRALPFRL